MDRLTIEQRLAIQKVSWHPSFDGQSIVSEDGTFLYVNPQFCKLLGVTPADLIDKKFQDITPPDVREVDVKNAKLVVDGKIDFYLLPKTYEFPDGRKIDVILLVQRVPAMGEGPFEFFLSRILLDKKEDTLSDQRIENTDSEQSSLTLTKMVVDFLLKYGKIFVAIGAILAGAAITFLGVIK